MQPIWSNLEGSCESFKTGTQRGGKKGERRGDWHGEEGGEEWKRKICKLLSQMNGEYYCCYKGLWNTWSVLKYEQSPPNFFCSPTNLHLWAAYHQMEAQALIFMQHSPWSCTHRAVNGTTVFLVVLAVISVVAYLACNHLPAQDMLFFISNLQSAFNCKRSPDFPTFVCKCNLRGKVGRPGNILWSAISTARTSLVMSIFYSILNKLWIDNLL